MYTIYRKDGGYPISNLVSILEANQNFSKLARLVDKIGQRAPF